MTSPQEPISPETSAPHDAPCPPTIQPHAESLLEKDVEAAKAEEGTEAKPAQSSPPQNEDDSVPAAPLWRFRRHGLRVTDLSDQQWCEQRLQFSLTFGKEDTKEMKQGRERHQALHEEIAEIVRVRPETRADLWMLHFFNAWSALQQLQEEGLCREIPVFGSLGDVWIVGVIDQIQTREDGRLVLSDTKTRRRNSMPSMAQKRTTHMQMMTYHSLWTSLARGPDPVQLFALIGLDLRVKASQAFLQELQTYGAPTEHPFEMLQQMLAAFAWQPPLVPEMTIRYEWQEDQSLVGVDQFRFDQTWLQKQIQQSLPFWWGERDARGVPRHEGWKCRFCPFIEDCQVKPQRR